MEKGNSTRASKRILFSAKRMSCLIRGGARNKPFPRNCLFLFRAFFKKTSVISSLKSLCAKVHQVECATLVAPHFFTSFFFKAPFFEVQMCLWKLKKMPGSK